MNLGVTLVNPITIGFRTSLVEVRMISLLSLMSKTSNEKLLKSFKKYMGHHMSRPSTPVAYSCPLLLKPCALALWCTPVRATMSGETEGGSEEGEGGRSLSGTNTRVPKEEEQMVVNID